MVLNLAESQVSNSERGLFSEYLVYQHFIKKQFLLFAHRYQTPFAEVDFIFQKTGSPALLIEVKSSSSADFEGHLISYRQKSKLLMVRKYLENYFEEVVFLLACVSHDASIELFEDF